MRNGKIDQIYVLLVNFIKLKLIVLRIRFSEWYKNEDVCCESQVLLDSIYIELHQCYLARFLITTATCLAAGFGQ